MIMQKTKNAIWGAIVGDAVGVPYEFLDRGSFEATDMVGMGTHEQPIGTWSDDSSMMLCILESINENRSVDCDDIKKKFKDWAGETGYMTPHGRVFDIGNTTSQALFDMPWFDKFSDTANGNGSLMRTLPLAFCNTETPDQFKTNICNVSEITHGHPRSKLACFLYCLIAKHLLNQDSFHTAYILALKEFKRSRILKIFNEETYNFIDIMDSSILDRPENHIQSSGYVLHTLEATIWCMSNSTSYKEAVLKAVNLGDDTDTTACVVGGLAGMIWGVPEDWKKQLVKHDMLDKIIYGIPE